jgi:xylulokinase
MTSASHDAAEGNHGPDGPDGRDGPDGPDGAVLIGCDVGTSAVKTIVCSAYGTLLGRSAAEHPMHHPRPGWAENDPEDWYAGLIQTIRAAVAGSAVDPARVAGLAVVCQREPVVLTDAAGAPLAPAISWTDLRATAESSDIAARIGRGRLIATTGMTTSPGMSLAHLLWFQRYRPGLWRSVRRIRFAKDYLLHRLTGCPAGDVPTDPTTPSRSGLLDVARRRWSGEICAAFGIDPGLLPPIGAQPWQRVSGLPAGVAREVGLRPGVPVAMGGSDDAAATLGCGATEPGQVSVGTGTAANWRTVLDRWLPDHSGRGDVSPHVVPDRYIHEVAIESTGSSLRWLRDVLNGPSSGQAGFDELIRSAAEVTCGADGLLCFPFVDGAGRAPRYAAGARGAYLGAVSGHTRGHLARAMLEGIAFQYRATLPLAGQRAAGGGPGPGDAIATGDGEAHNPVWNQLKADVLGVPLRVPRITDLAAAGAAILAGIAGGVFADAAAGAAGLVSWDRRYDPDPRRTAEYAKLSARYELAYQRLARTFGRDQRPDRAGQTSQSTSGTRQGTQA